MAALAKIIRRGLPVAAVVDPVLLVLQGVIARTIDPDDDASRTAALDGVLRGQLARFPDARYGQAARALFGLPPAEPGQNLTVRRQRAALAAGHEVHHFRKRVEPRLLNQLAAALLADADQFTRSRSIAPRLAPVSGRQVVPADPFAWEVAEHEEALARLWASIYALRAELLAVERLLSLDADRRESTMHAVMAAWRWAQASSEATGYAAAFETGGATAHDLVALAGWTPPLTIEQGARLRAAAADGADRAEFVAALHHDTELGVLWVNAFFASCGESPSVTLERQVS
jgi:hypothetical protein